MASSSATSGRIIGATAQPRGVAAAAAEGVIAAAAFDVDSHFRCHIAIP